MTLGLMAVALAAAIYTCHTSRPLALSLEELHLRTVSPYFSGIPIGLGRIKYVESLLQIPAPKPQMYANIQDYAHWENPYLTVLPDSVGIQCLAVDIRKKVPVSALHQTLLSLPLAAWPYGRVVAVQAGGGPTTPNSTRRIEQNRVQVDAILRSAEATIEYWPGA